MTDGQEIPTQTDELLAWARVRARYFDEDHAPAQLEMLLHPMSPTQAEALLDRVLANVTPVENESICSLDAARERRRRRWPVFNMTLTTLAAAAAATLLLFGKVDPTDPDGTSQDVVNPPDLAALAFEVDVHGGHAVMRGTAEQASVFREGDTITLSITPVERVHAPLEFRVFAVQDGRRIALPWKAQVGDPSLGDRELQGSGLAPGVWRLEIEAADPQTGSVRWLHAVNVQIDPRAVE